MLNYIKDILSFLNRKRKSKKISFSQTGIDLLLNNIFKNKKNGFYIDVGCNHPIFNNNTYLLYKRGWSGVNIDLDYDCINLFKKFRNADFNINCALSSTDGTKNLYFYHNKSPLNTLNKNVSDKQNAKVQKIKKIDTKTLNEILKNENLHDKTIDLLTIDVEGHELDVLKGFDLNYYKPKIVVLEFLDTKMNKLEIKNLNIKNVLNSEIFNYMTNNNYILINWLHSDLIFAENSFRD